MALLNERHDPITIDIVRAAKAGFFDRQKPFVPMTLGELEELWGRVKMMSRQERLSYLSAKFPGPEPASLSGKRVKRKGKRRASLLETL